MNLTLSYNWLKDYIKLNKSAADFAKEFSLKSMTIDRIKDLSEGLDGVVVGQLVEFSKHPDADRLNVAKVDVGKKEPIDLIFGQMLVLKPGDKLPVALAPTVLPTGQEIKKAELRGQPSEGMFCLNSELGFSGSGAIFFDENVKPGTKLIDTLDLKDSLFDIEVTTNRPDAMSVLGLAQEAAAVFGKKLNYKQSKPKLNKKFDKPLAVTVKDHKLCPRYQAVVMSDFKVGPSPMWLQARLISAGYKPINNLVDITNYIAFEYGQPMHVFDYDKIQGNKIVVRKAKPGEKIKALDDIEYELDHSNLVIADAKDPMAIAGVMGGTQWATYEVTKTLVFEAANFNPVSVRRTARKLNLYSDSSSRFEKGLHPHGTMSAILRAMELAEKIAGAKAVSPIIDAQAEKFNPTKIKLNSFDITRYLGVELKPKEVKKILESLGFKVTGSKAMVVTVPWWRTNDIKISNDLIEEVARIYGYHHFKAILPNGDLPIQRVDQILVWERQAKDYLVGMGLTEVYNYSFISQEDLQNVGLSTKKTVEISNPLNEGMVYMRTTLMPQILQNIKDNLKNNYPTQKIFELSQTYHLLDDKSLPQEKPRLIAAFSTKDGSPFLSAKGAVELLLKKMGVVQARLTVPDFHNLMWTKNSSLEIKVGDKYIGQVGIVSRDILSKFDLDIDVAVIDLDFELLVNFASTSMSYSPIPEFPAVWRDLAIVVAQDLLWQDIVDLVSTINELITTVHYLSTYTDKSLGQDKKSLAFRVMFRSPDRTLQSSEVDEIIKEIENKLQQKFDASLR